MRVEGLDLLSLLRHHLLDLGALLELLRRRHLHLLLHGCRVALLRLGLLEHRCGFLLRERALGLLAPSGELRAHDRLHVVIDLALPGLCELLLAHAALFLQEGALVLPARSLLIEVLLLRPRVMHDLLVVDLDVEVEDRVLVILVDSLAAALVLGLVGLAIRLLDLLGLALELCAAADDGLGILLPDRIVERLRLDRRRFHLHLGQLLRILQGELQALVLLLERLELLVVGMRLHDLLHVDEADARGSRLLDGFVPRHQRADAPGPEEDEADGDGTAEQDFLALRLPEACLLGRARGLCLIWIVHALSPPYK